MSDASDTSLPGHSIAEHCTLIARICCAIAVAVGLAVLTGWCLDNLVLKSVLPGAVAMKPNTAVALCLGAISLLLFTRLSAHAGGWQRNLSITCAASMSAIGALTLAEYISGVGFGIDELLFRDHARSAAVTYHPGRMAPISAFNILTLGIAFVLIHWRKATLWAQAITGCAAFTSVLAIVGYFFSVAALYRSGNFTAVALNTAISFIALCIGLWCATCDFGFMRLITGTGVSGIVVRRFGLAALVLPLATSWVHLQGEYRAWYEPAFGEALFAMINVVSFAILIWVGAVSLRKAEVKEAAVQERLRCAHLELEDRVEERTRALAAALHVNQRIMDYSLDVICIIDPEGRFTTVSAACEKVWGYTPAELIGRRFIELVHPDDHEKTNRTAAALVTGQVVRDFENRYLRKDGTTVAVTWSVYWSEAEKLMFCVARDATERKRSEEALRQATQDAERANRAKSEFLANMSHEIRTPMNGILGMTELTLDTELNQEQREYLGMVKTSAHSLLGIINDILDFSKIEAGKLEMESISFSLRDTVGAFLKPLGVRADEKHLELVADIPADVPDHLIGDPLRLRQILLNLTDNAIKFTETGEVIVRAAVESAADGETELHFSVADSGIGIPPEKQSAIFDAFSQVDGSTTRNYGGTGLGLAIATRLVQQMRGRIWVESRLGVGTTFHFTAWLQNRAEALPEVTPISFSQLTGMRVLVVDDNAVNCRILQEMLRNWRMRPTVVNSAAAALVEMRSAAAAGRPFPLVLLDALMPEMDGFALAEQIKREERLAKATVMMLSSAMRSGEARRATSLGLDSVLTKPVLQSELLDAILLALSGKDIAPAPDQRVEIPQEARTAGALQILVVEDNAINQAVVAGMLSRLGHSLVRASNGLEALDALAAKKFDLVLMDIQMPEMDGFQATARIRETEAGTGRRLPIIAMTAHAMTGDRERCIAAGMDDYVSKPVRREELQRALGAIKGGGALVPDEGTSATVFSYAELLDQCDGDQVLLEEVILLFRDDTPRSVAVMQSAAARRDAAGVAAGAHKLLSSLGAVGASNARAIGFQLAAASDTDDFATLNEQLANLARELDLIDAVLARYLAQSRSLPAESEAGILSTSVRAKDYAAV